MPPTPAASSVPPFAAARQRLDDALGAHVSDFRLACALGVAMSTIEDLTRGRRPCRGVYLVALEHVARIGVDAADEMDDVSPTTFRHLVRSLVLTPTQIGRVLGLHADTLPQMVRDVGARRQTIRRVYYLALLEMEHVAGPGSALGRWLS